MHITFIQMGGTIDKEYPQVPNAYGFHIGDPKVVTLLETWSTEWTYEIISIAKKDSQDITKEDLKSLVTTIKNGGVDQRIIITHGTDTMKETASNLVNSELENNIIVLTGSRVPASMLNSDAALNIGMAIGVAQGMNSGIYIVLDGSIDAII